MFRCLGVAKKTEKRKKRKKEKKKKRKNKIINITRKRGLRGEGGSTTSENLVILTHLAFDVITVLCRLIGASTVS